MTSVGILCEFLQKNKQSKMKKNVMAHKKDYFFLIHDEKVRDVFVKNMHDLRVLFVLAHLQFPCTT